MVCYVQYMLERKKKRKEALGDTIDRRYKAVFIVGFAANTKSLS